MKLLATLPTDVPALQQLVLEQQHMIDTLKEQLRLSLRRQFGPRNEFVNVDQLGLFAISSNDDSTIIEVTVGISEAVNATNADDDNTNLPAERKKAIRILKDLPRDIRIIDIPDAEKTCSCCGGALHPMKDESAEHLEYIPSTLKLLKHAVKNTRAIIVTVKLNAPKKIFHHCFLKAWRHRA